MENKIAIQDGESLDEYTDRLCVNKLEYGLKWDNIAALVNAEAGTDYSGDKFRKQFNKKTEMESTRKVMESVDDCTELDANSFLLEMQKLKVQARDERTTANAFYRAISREDTLKEMAADYAKTMSEKKLLPYVECHVQNKNGKVAILNIGDWHYGLEVSNYWNIFNTDICKARVALLTKKTIEYCTMHNVSKIIVNGLGDYISGLIHLPLRIYSQEDVVSQTMSVTEIIAEMLSELSINFKVEFFNVLGNHARLMPNKKESINLESLERFVTWGLEMRLAENENVDIVYNELDDDITIFSAGKFTFAAVHGDRDSVSTVVRNLTLMTDIHYDCIITAHKHHLSADEQNKCLVISNPSLIGVDDYSKGLRLSSTPAQTLIIVGEDSPVECLYYIPLEKV